MLTQPVRLGVIGTGWGKVHAQAASQLDGAFLVTAIWSRGSAQRAAAAEEFGLPASACEADWRALIGRDDVDVVVIATPDELHHAIATEAVKQGKHVICEKPLAPTSAEAATMLEAAETAGVQHLVAFLWRYAAPIATVKDLLDRGVLGVPLALDMQFRIGPPRAGREWQRSRHGGVLSNLMVHLVDLARYLQAQPGCDGMSGSAQTWQLWAHTAAAQGPDSEGLPLSQAWLHIQSDTGVSMRLQASQDWGVRTTFPLRVEVHGSRASAVACANPLRPDWDRVDLIERLSGAAESQTLCHPGGQPSTEMTSTSASGYLLPATRHLYKTFVAPALLSGEPAADAPTFHDGLKAQRVIDTALRSAQSRAWQSITV